MPNLNKVMLMGNLTKDPELRYTGGGAAVCNLRMAMNRTYKSKAGEKKEEVCYMTVVAWNEQAEACGEYLKKGSSIFVEGRLQSRTWEKEDKTKGYAIEVVAERIQFLDRKGETKESVPDHGADQAPPAGEEDIPF